MKTRKTSTLSDEEYCNFRKHIKCNWIKCYAGLGLAGRGLCIANGNPRTENCRKFIDEEEYIRKRENEEIRVLLLRGIK